MIDYGDTDAVESLLPTPEEDYEKAVEETFVRRLALMLVANGILSEQQAVDLAYPSWEQIRAVYENHNGR